MTPAELPEPKGDGGKKKKDDELVHIDMPEPKGPVVGEEGAPIFKRRREFIEHEDFSFSPTSLLGSYCHRVDPNDGMIWEGRIVGHMAEGQGENVYLVELTQSVEGQKRIPVQMPVRFAEMINKDDGHEWRLYDDEETMRAAAAEYIATVKTEES